MLFIMGICLLLLGVIILYKNEFTAFLLGLAYFTTALMYTLKLKYIPYIDSATMKIVFIYSKASDRGLFCEYFAFYISNNVYIFLNLRPCVSKRISILQDDRSSRRQSLKMYMQVLKKIL